MGTIINISTEQRAFIDQCLLDMIGTDVFGVECTLYMPPIPTPCSNCVPDPIGQKSSNIYLNGGPTPFENGQICPMCGGVYIIAQQSTETVIFTIEYKIEKFLDILKQTIRYPQNAIQTRGFVSDMQKVLNCTDMEINRNAGVAHYRYKLSGEPLIAGKLSDDYFYAAWERV